MSAEGSSHEFRAETLSLGYDHRSVITGLDLDIPPHRIGAIIGPNGCGKSTLLRGLARLIRPTEGRVVLDGRAVHELPTRQVARVLGLLPQTPIAPEGILVEDLVSRGRSPHRGAFSRWSAADDKAVAVALTQTHTEELADRPVDELSGGQRQRVWIAMALAQGTDLLLLDEPTTYLDVAHQVDVLDLLTELNETRGTTIVMVLHDINLASRYADWLVAVQEGRIVARGTPAEVVTEPLIRAALGLEARVVDDPVSGTPLVVPIGRRERRRGKERHPDPAAGGPASAVGPGTDGTRTVSAIASADARASVPASAFAPAPRRGHP